MNRLLLALNVCLALFLGLQILTVDAGGGDALAGASGTPRRAGARWTAEDVKLLQVRGGGTRPHLLVFELGRPLPNPDSNGEPGLELRLEPAFDCDVQRRTHSEFALYTADPLPRARRFTVHLASPVTAADGAVLEPGPLFAFETDPVELRELQLRDDPAEEQVELVFDFDLPVAAEELRDHLELTDVMRDRALEFAVESRPWRDRELLHVTPRLDEEVTAVVATISSGLRSRGAELATAQDIARHVELRSPLALTRATVERWGIELRFNRSIDLPADHDAAALADWLTIEPRRPLRVEASRGGLRLYGDFEPGGTVGLRLHAGFPGFGRRTLPEDARRSLLVDDLDPDVGFAQRGRLLSAHALPELRLRGVNVEAVEVTARRVYPNNVVRMLQTGDHHSMAPAMVRRIEVQAARNETAEIRLDLRELLASDEPRGLWHLALTHDETWRPAEERLLQITDLGVTVRTAGGSAAIQVVSIADGGPVEGAGLEVLSATNQTLARGVTGADGTALLRWPVDGADRHAFVVRARLGDDQAFVDREGHAVELTDPTLGGRPFAGPLPEAWVWPSRGVVRPGGHLDTTVVLRDAEGRAAVGHAVEVRFRRPDGRIHSRQRHTTPGSGLLAVGLDVGTEAPVGGWRVDVCEPDDGPELGGAAFQVEAFVPLRLEAEVRVDGAMRAGAPVDVVVQGRWLDGTPAGGRPVALRSRLDSAPFESDAVAGFSFTVSEPEPPFGALPTEHGVLDAEGRAVFTLQLPRDPGAQALRALLRAEVIDPSGRTVRAATSAPVLRDDFHLGVRATGDGITACTIDADGAWVPAPADLELRLERRRWRWDYRSVGERRWRWVTTVEREVLAEQRLTAPAGRAAWPLAYPEGDGWLVAVARCGDREVEQEVGERPEPPDRLRVGSPAAPVAPGGTATLAVSSPAAGRGFVTLEGPEVLAVRVFELQRGDNRLSVILPDDVRLPNLHAVVTLTRPAREVGAGQGPAWLSGGASIALRRDDLPDALTLTVPAEVRPDATLECVVDAPGASSAVLAVVDEGVLAITDHASPDPRGHFMARRRLAGLGFDGFTDLLEDATFVAGTKTGGDGGDSLLGDLLMGSISPRIRPLALFTTVALDAAGRGTARFELPAYDGRLRVMAVAAGPRQLAASTAATVVKAPLTLRLAAPRMVAPGDRFALPLSLRNDTGAGGPVALHAELEGPLELAADLPTYVTLEPGAEIVVDVELRALTPDAGEATPVATLTVSAELGGERRRVHQRLQVRELVLRRRTVLGLALDQPRRITVADDWVAAGLRGTLRVHAHPDAQLRPALEALLVYPYGCVEQTTSRGFALLGCAALLTRIYGEDANPPDAGALVQAAVDRLVGMQQPDGGFGWWPGSLEEYPFGTLYAVDFLLAAAERGHQVPESTLVCGLARVTRIARAPGDVSLRCYAAEIGSRAGQPARGLLEWLATQTRWQEDRLLLAMALHRLGDEQAGLRLLREPADPADRPARADLLCSPLRDQSLRLRATLAADPGDDSLPAQVLGLQRQILDASAHTTQELGQALRALSAYYRVHRDDRTTRLVGSLDGVPLVPDESGAVTLDVRPGSVLDLGGGGSGFALLEIDGRRPPAGRPWTLEPPPAGASTATSDAVDAREEPGTGPSSASTGVLRRSFHDLDTGEQVDSLRHGRLYEVRLVGSGFDHAPHLAVADLLPGGVEPATLERGFEPVRALGPGEPVATRIERRDDRVLLFPSEPVTGSFVLRHYVRATMPGRYVLPPAIAELMYDPTATIVVDGPDDIEVHR